MHPVTLHLSPSARSKPPLPRPQSPACPTHPVGNSSPPQSPQLRVHRQHHRNRPRHQQKAWSPGPKSPWKLRVALAEAMSWTSDSVGFFSFNQSARRNVQNQDHRGQPRSLRILRDHPPRRRQISPPKDRSPPRYSCRRRHSYRHRRSTRRRASPGPAPAACLRNLSQLLH